MITEITQKVISLWQQKKILNVALLGSLGAGKTFFVRELVTQFYPSLASQVCSPTFGYFNIYQNDNITIHHFDLYRVTEKFKLLDIGLWESIEDQNSLTLIEWADLFSEVVEECNLQLKFFNENGKYRIKF